MKMTHDNELGAVDRLKKGHERKESNRCHSVREIEVKPK